MPFQASTRSLGPSAVAHDISRTWPQSTRDLCRSDVKAHEFRPFPEIFSKLLGPLVQPYARVGKDGVVRYLVAEVEYPEFPLMRRSALAHFVEVKYNQLEPKWHRSHEVSQALVKEMADLAQKHEVKFVVANILGGRQMLDFAERNRISNVDIAVDLRLPENTNRPYDHHPSGVAHRRYADKLERFLIADL